MKIFAPVLRVKFKAKYLTGKKIQGLQLHWFSRSSIGMCTEKDSCYTICKKYVSLGLAETVSSFI